ncbi:FtsB family cell division protein [Desulfogranum mediterraneum]|uniref:FtsB family cell division protein n=1 Tax=Desulfogranum mediterraneum TaxID=160661 RepID=UPI00068890E2|nr:septum formation initiator family protein [Desulfogranum mediterraneum]
MDERKGQKSASRRRRLLWRLGVLIGMGTVLALLFLPGRGLFQLRRLQQHATELEEENVRLQEDKARLAAEIERLKGDEAYIEQLAREKYGLLKPNEEVFDFNPPAKRRK